MRSAFCSLEESHYFDRSEFGNTSSHDREETVNSASMSGVVTDPTGAIVVGASVTARQTDTNVPALLSAITKDNLDSHT